jgi:hypothetical protein
VTPRTSPRFPPREMSSYEAFRDNGANADIETSVLELHDGA